MKKKNRNNISRFVVSYMKRSAGAEVFEDREFRHMSALMAINYAKVFRGKYKLPSIIMGMRKDGDGFRVRFIKGQATLKDAVTIPDYDVKEALETFPETKWVLCLVSKDQFVELDIDHEENSTLQHVLGLKRTLWDI